MKIDNQPVDSRIISEWKAEIDACKESDLQVFASQHQHLSAGFRKGKVNFQVATTRIKANLDQATEAPAYLADFLRKITLSDQMIAVFSEELIAKHHMMLATAYGRAKVYAAMLLDRREVVRAQAFVELAKWDGAEPTDNARNTAAMDLQSTLKSFLGLIAELVAHPGTTSLVDKSPVESSVIKRDAGAEKLAVELRERRQDISRLRRELQEANADRERLNSQVRVVQKSLSLATSELLTISTEHQNLRVQFTERVQEEVAKQLHQRLIPWLQPAEALAAHAGVTNSDLVSNVEALLLRQAAIDQKYGLRSALETKLTQYRALVERLRTAIKESLHPLAELADHVQKVEQRILELETILQQTSSTSTHAGVVPALLRERLQQANTLEKVAQVRRGLVAIESVGLLAADDLQAAYAYISDVASRLYLRASLGQKTKSGETSLDGIPLYALQRQIAEGQLCTLVIDGFNVIFLLPDIFGGHFEKADPGKISRDLLMKKLEELSLNHTNLTVELWFDGNTAQDKTVNDNFRVHFSGGTGADRADKRILAHLDFLRRSPVQQLRALVTADKDEAEQARDLGALIISPQEFAVLIS